MLSPHNADIVYYAANRLFRSFDKGRTWTAISGDLTTSTQRGDVPYATITSVSESPKQFGLIWAGTDDGHVWVTTSGGDRWTAVDAQLPADRWVSRVIASSHVRDRAYVALNGYRNDDATPYLFASDDLGAHWRGIAKGLPDEAVNVVREDPVNADVLYVGTDRGVYVTLDRGASWTALDAGLPNVPVHDLVVHPRAQRRGLGSRLAARTIAALGAMDRKLFIVPSLKLIVVRTGQGAPDKDFNEKLWQLIDTAMPQH